MFTTVLYDLTNLIIMQVTIEHKLDDGAVIPLRVHTIVISAQHAPEIGIEDLRRELMEKVNLLKW